MANGARLQELLDGDTASPVRPAARRQGRGSAKGEVPDRERRVLPEQQLTGMFDLFCDRPRVRNGELTVLGGKPVRDLDRGVEIIDCLLYTSPSPRDRQKSRMPSSA